ncbi:hypothetical protein D6D26_02099 [Aureobasidium pullulans]|nr:hypothetical protein D6D26_02099 [Aureobasidium pullulans]
MENHPDPNYIFDYQNDIRVFSADSLALRTDLFESSPEHEAGYAKWCRRVRLPECDPKSLAKASPTRFTNPWMNRTGKLLLADDPRLLLMSPFSVAIHPDRRHVRSWNCRDPTLGRLVDIYLACIASPGSKMDATVKQPSRHVLLDELWPQAKQHKALLFPLLLGALYYETFSRQHPRESHLTTYLRDHACRAISHQIENHGNDDPIALAAVSTLAAFEVEYGDLTIAGIFIERIRKVNGMDNVPPLFHQPPHLDVMLKRSCHDGRMFVRLPPAFLWAKNQPFKIQHSYHPGNVYSEALSLSIIQPSLLEILAEVRDDRGASDNLLQNSLERIEDWHVNKFQVLTFSPVQGWFDDEILDTAHSLLHMAAYCTVLRMQSTYHADNKMRRANSPRPPSNDLSILEGTIFEPMCLLALLVICTTAPYSQSFREDFQTDQTGFAGYAVGLLRRLEYVYAISASRAGEKAPTFLKKVLSSYALDPADSSVLDEFMQFMQEHRGTVPVMHEPNIARYHRSCYLTRIT